jgi:hypothetical protein
VTHCSFARGKTLEAWYISGFGWHMLYKTRSFRYKIIHSYTLHTYIPYQDTKTTVFEYHLTSYTQSTTMPPRPNMVYLDGTTPIGIGAQLRAQAAAQNAARPQIDYNCKANFAAPRRGYGGEKGGKKKDRKKRGGCEVM